MKLVMLDRDGAMLRDGFVVIGNMLGAFDGTAVVVGACTTAKITVLDTDEVSKFTATFAVSTDSDTFKIDPLIALISIFF
jgi:hypothetical protein